MTHSTFFTHVFASAMEHHVCIYMNLDYPCADGHMYTYSITVSVIVNRIHHLSSHPEQGCWCFTSN